MLTKKTVEKNIKENDVFKSSIEKLSESERQTIFLEVDRIIDLFYSTILEPLQKHNVE
jgi:hypothetical protein